MPRHTGCAQLTVYSECGIDTNWDFIILPFSVGDEFEEGAQALFLEKRA